MFLRQAIASALHLFVVFVFFTAGIFFVLLPYLPLTRIEIIDFLSNRYQQCTQIGMGFFLVALVLFVGFYALNRGKYLVVRMGLSTDLKVVRQAIEDCFAKQLNQRISLKEVALGPKDYLNFKVHFSSDDESIREQLFVEAEKHLTSLLHERFGYSKPFHLIVKI